MNGTIIELDRPPPRPAPDRRTCRHRALLRDLTRALENAFQRFDEPTAPQIQALLDRAYTALGLVKVIHPDAPGGYVAMTFEEAQAALAELLGRRVEP